MIKTPLSTVIGGAFWTPGCTIIGGASKKTFNQIIKKLFANNEQGFAYDPNDLSTMWQDAAGTVPVTAAGQPVGLILDKSKGLVLGTELASVTEVVSLPVDGVSGVKTYPIGTVAIGKTYQISFTVSNFTGAGDVGVAGPTTHWLDGTSVFVSSNGTTRCIRTKLTTSEVYLYTRNTAACVFSNISIKELKGNHTFQTTSASRPILRKNAVTGANYLEFDGTDDFLQTNSIDFTATDKVSLFTGVRKLSDAQIGAVAELSPQINSNNGSFTVFAPGGASPRIDFLSKGTVIGQATYSSGLAAAPVSTVVTGVGDISGDRSTLKVDGAIVSTSMVDQGTGNYGNYPLYIGRRGGTQLPFNGHIYGLIGIGKLVSDIETVAIEKELAKRVGVDLNV